MKCYCARDSDGGEVRTAVTPDSVMKLGALGVEVVIEHGVGERSGFSDREYVSAGASLVRESLQQKAEADLLLRINAANDGAQGFRRGVVSISLLDPFGPGLAIRELAKAHVSALALEFIPRSTLAQKMDVLSSQASLAGYAAVLLASERIDTPLPMMTTPAGTLKPCRVLVVGAGVAGLQAIATAKRLGARVEAFDTRPSVEEQVRSLGAKFVNIDLGATQATSDGYAKSISAEQLAAQQQALGKVCAQSDVVITTAKVFGAKAPLIVTQAMVAGMRAGSVIVDLAADTGGNVELTVPGQSVVTTNGVCIIGETVLERHVARAASQMFASNVASLVEHGLTRGLQTRDFSDPILSQCLVTHGGEVVHPRLVERMKAHGVSNRREPSTMGPSSVTA